MVTELQKKAMRAKRKERPSQEEDDKKLAASIDADRWAEPDPMGQTVVQGQQSEEWKAAHPFESAQLDSQNEIAAKKAKALINKQAGK